MVTLVGQGLTFGPLVRRLHFPNADLEIALVRNRARLAAIEAGAGPAGPARGRRRAYPAESSRWRCGAAASSGANRYADRVALLSSVEDDELPQDDRRELAGRLHRAMLDAERASLLDWRDTGRLPDESLRVLQRELDHEESLLPQVAQGAAE